METIANYSVEVKIKTSDLKELLLVIGCLF